MSDFLSLDDVMYSRDPNTLELFGLQAVVVVINLDKTVELVTCIFQSEMGSCIIWIFVWVQACRSSQQGWLL